MKRYGVILIGCGTVADYGHLPAIRRNRRARLISVVDCIAEKAKAAAGKFGAETWSDDYRKFLDRKDIDVVVVTTPPSAYARIVIDFLKAGKPVLCEKPLTDNLTDARRILDAVRKTRRHLMVGYILRHNDAYRKAQELIHEGRLGFPLVMRMMGAEHYETVNFRTFKNGLCRFFQGGDEEPGNS